MKKSYLPFGERKFCEIKLHKTGYLMFFLFCFFFLSPIVLGCLGFFETNREKCSLLEAQKKFVCTI